MRQDGEQLRVLHVIPSISSVNGGPSRALALMEKALTTAGVQVTTATTDDDGPRRRLPSAERILRRNGAERFYARKWMDFYKVAPGIAVWLWRNVQNFDVIHIHALFSFSSVMASLIARWRKVPYIVRPLGTLAAYGMTQRRPRLKKLSLCFLDGPILQRAAAVQFTSQAELDGAKALGIQCHATLIPLGVESTVTTSASEIKCYFPEINQRKAVLCLARLDPVKNLEGLLHAAALVDWASRGAVLLIAGDGDPLYVESLKRLAASLGIEDHILWLGYLDGARKEAAFASSVLFVLPSFSENFGIAIVEAMLAGLSCILGEGVGIAPQVKASGAGLIVTPDPQDIARAIDTLLCDEPKRIAIATIGKSFAEAEYSTSRMTERLVDMYKEALLCTLR